MMVESWPHIMDQLISRVALLLTTLHHNGGVMSTLEGSFTIISSNFTNNTAGFMVTLNGSLTIMSSNFTNNTATQLGGVMYTVFASPTIIITCCIFANNIAEVGGVIWSLDGSFSISSSTFNNNTAGSYVIVKAQGQGFMAVNEPSPRA